MKGETLGMRLRHARDLKRYNQKQVEEITGISHVNLSRYELDQTSPGIETLKKLADLYEVSIDWVFGATDKPNRVSPQELKDIGIDWVEVKNDAAAVGLTAEDVKELIKVHSKIMGNIRNHKA